MNTHNPQQAEPTRSRGPKRSDPHGRAPHKNMVWIPGGTFLMGSNDFYPEERPVHRVTVDGFWMDEHTVTNAEFRRFVKATGHITVAERPADPADYPGARPEMLVPGSVVFRQPPAPRRPAQPLQLVGLCAGSELAPPRGPRQHAPRPGAASGGACRLRGRRGLRELGWAKSFPPRPSGSSPRAAGWRARTYAWGDEFSPKGKAMANTWQGEFPMAEPADRQVRADSACRVVPAERLRAVRHDGQRLGMDYGLVSGSSASPKVPAAAASTLPSATREQSYDPQMPDVPIPRKVIKGGSFLCAPNYCRRYRPAARMAPPGRYRYVPHRVPLHRSPRETPS